MQPVARPIATRLTADQLDALDELAASFGASRAGFLRMLVARAVADAQAGKPVLR